MASRELADDLALGSAAVGGRLTLWNAASDVESIRLVGADHRISLHRNTGIEQLRLDGRIGGHLLLFDYLNGDQTVSL